MGKKRIILADTDYDYLALLEQKFAEELMDHAQLEIITDAEYFEGLFSKLQQIDILVVSENLYTDELKKHRIQQTFVLTEGKTERKINRSGVEFLFKYTSTNQIYNRVITGVKPPEKTKTLLVYSPIGGCGKTTIALGLCAGLSKQYKKVLYIDAEYMNTFQCYMNNPGYLPEDAYQEWMSPSSDFYERIKKYIRSEDFDYIPPFAYALSVLGIGISAFQDLIESVKESGDYEYIIIDTDSVFYGAKAALMECADKIILLTGQDRISIHRVNVFMKNIKHSNMDKYIFICNQFDSQKENMLVSADSLFHYSIESYIPYYNDQSECFPGMLSEKTDLQKITFLVDDF